MIDLQSKAPKKLAKLWVQGYGIAWAELYADSGLQRVAGLPSYSFAARMCWPKFDVNAAIAHS
ncbi:MAG: hypothetical protein JKY84_02190, partial [Emcibacteraceae bacterium]|nr:hypothetical protein [Emcibacteraceae bacterium]